MTDLTVPMARNHAGQMVSPECAEKGNTYTCPSCEITLVLRKGERNRVHFSHPHNSTCSNETILHKIAKYLIVEVITDFSSTGISPIIIRKCPHCLNETNEQLSEHITSAAIEKTLSTGFKVDVAIYVEKIITAAIEIKHTHAVGDEKQQTIGLPFLELLAQDVLENSVVWKPNLDEFPSFECQDCLETKQIFWKYLNSLSRITKISLPRAHFRATGFTCWNEACLAEYLVFDWPERKEGKEPPVIDRPSTIQYRYSKTTGSKSWVNTCPQCKKMLGEFYWPALCDERSVDTQESYQTDMLDLAIRYVSSGWPSYSWEIEPKKKEEDVLNLTPTYSPEDPKQLFEFKCRVCKSQWSGSRAKNLCLKCNTHLYVSEI